MRRKLKEGHFLSDDCHLRVGQRKLDGDSFSSPDLCIGDSSRVFFLHGLFHGFRADTFMTLSFSIAIMMGRSGRRRASVIAM